MQYDTSRSMPTSETRCAQYETLTRLVPDLLALYSKTCSKQPISERVQGCRWGGAIGFRGLVVRAAESAPTVRGKDRGVVDLKPRQQLLPAGGVLLGVRLRCKVDQVRWKAKVEAHVTFIQHISLLH